MSFITLRGQHLDTDDPSMNKSTKQWNTVVDQQDSLAKRWDELEEKGSELEAGSTDAGPFWSGTDLKNCARTGSDSTGEHPNTRKRVIQGLISGWN